MKRLEILSLLLVFCLVSSMNCKINDNPYPSCDGQLNDKPLINLKPQLQKSVSNGEQYLIQDGTNFLYIMNVRGSAYEMGYAQGQLMGEQIKENGEGMLNYVVDSLVDSAIEYLPILKLYRKKLSAILMNLLNFALDLNYYVSKDFTPERYDQEIQGINDGSNGVADYLLIRRTNLVPELTQAACTIVGAWNQSTLSKDILQLRSLDWESSAPVVKYPSIVIYNSTEKGSNIFANIGFAGLVGSITGMSKNGIAVGEKVWLPRSDVQPHPQITYIGKPWTYVLRDLVQFGQNLSNMIETIYQTNRTMRIHIGMSSVPDNSFRGWDYSYNIVENFNDKNYTAYSPAHPQLDGVFYFDKHVQPSNNACIGEILSKNWGSITPATLYREVAGFHKTGDTQMCTMNPTSGEIWVSYSEYGTTQLAYQRSPIYVDLTQFWGKN